MADHPDKQPFVIFPNSQYDVYREQHPGDRVPDDPMLHDPPVQSGLVDVQVSRPRLNNAAVIGMLIAFGCVFGIGLFFPWMRTSGRLGPMAMAVVIGAVGLPIVYLFLRYLRSRARFKAGHLVRGSVNLSEAELVRVVFSKWPFDVKESPKEMVRSMAKVGRGGAVIRVYHHGTGRSACAEGETAEYAEPVARLQSSEKRTMYLSILADELVDLRVRRTTDGSWNGDGARDATCAAGLAESAGAAAGGAIERSDVNLQVTPTICR